jgi:hypothetical protein
MNPDTVLKVIQIVLTAEPAVVSAIHNLLTGTGTATDLVVLKADALAWQAIADHAAAQIALLKPPTPATLAR